MLSRSGITGSRFAGNRFPNILRTVTNPRTLNQNTYLGALNGACVVVRVGAAEQDHTLAFAEGLDHVLRVLVNVDCARVPLAHGV